MYYLVSDQQPATLSLIYLLWYVAGHGNGSTGFEMKMSAATLGGEA